MNKREYIAALERGKEIAVRLLHMGVGLATYYNSRRYYESQNVMVNIRKLSQKACVSCKSCCCHLPEGYWAPMDWVLYLLFIQGTRGTFVKDIRKTPLPMPSSKQAMIKATWQDRDSKSDVEYPLCQFLHPDEGCQLPALGRPRVCLTYTCGRWVNILAGINPDRRDATGVDFEKREVIINWLGFTIRQINENLDTLQHLVLDAAHKSRQQEDIEYLQQGTCVRLNIDRGKV